MENGFCSGPRLNLRSLPPLIQLSNHSVYEILLLAGLEKICAAFFVQTVD
jgi:hypothetical protein